MASTTFVEVLPDPLQLNKYVGLVEDSGAGALATFMGVTRDNFDGKRVLSLSYEAYVPMAEKEMQVSACTSGQILTL
jgi:molybdopterin synthase catalytic subunit